MPPQDKHKGWKKDNEYNSLNRQLPFLICLCLNSISFSPAIHLSTWLPWSRSIPSHANTRIFYWLVHPFFHTIPTMASLSYYFDSLNPHISQGSTITLPMWNVGHTWDRLAVCLTHTKHNYHTTHGSGPRSGLIPYVTPIRAVLDLLGSDTICNNMGSHPKWLA